MSLRRIFKFAKPKTPGYGIAKPFYVSVLSGHAQLPSPSQIVHPKGEQGAVEGFIAPLSRDAEKGDLDRPMQRGVYAVATPDRKTVLRVHAVSKEEAGFDPEPVAHSALAATISPESMARIRATWMLLQFTFEAHDAMVSPAMSFLYRVLKRTGDLTEGVIADPTAQRYMLPADLPVPDSKGPLAAADHVSIRFLERNGLESAFTLGMQKFALPELEIGGLGVGDESKAGSFLLSLCQARLEGTELTAGTRVGSRSAPFDIAVGGLDRARWEGIPVLELLPPRTGTVSDALAAWIAEQGLQRG